ncbi:GNAT family N-acetyltransferase [Sphingosinicella sp. CPCC 101087]|uniref:GNAT family N-acetyltransferase n=1 Tax=Sphingosinicella sp. CPCC 101087 TaxID=2497754 RepID=UPI00101D6836|nr:N-acetyltransferase [Sphingosinicella sp. CPCC 101087]
MSRIRPERPGDEAAIASVIERAFGRPDEARLVERLRADGDSVVSLVAEAEGELAGHVLLSRMSAPFRALGLGPVSVAPERQRSGVGAALIGDALALARSGGWDAAFVLGDPAYYGRFGFRADLAACFASPYAGPYLMLLPLAPPLPAAGGRIDYPPAFAGLE